MTKMWMVKAGDKGDFYDEFKNRNIVVIGWGIGDVKNKSKEEIKEILKKNYPNVTPNTIGKWFPSIFDFNSSIEEGDYVLTASHKSTKKFLLGKVVSDCRCSEEFIEIGVDPDRKYDNVRDVRWLCEFPWAAVSIKNRKFIIRPPTCFEITGEAKEEILNYYSWNSSYKRDIIYFGAPGTGKSHNLNQDKSNLILDKNGHERVTFHPDYSYANFVGTYKPFVPKEDSISYKYVPGPFMRTLVKALKNPNKPFLLLIEEINRSNVAAVFGDVFQLLDRDKNQESKFPIETTEDMRSFLENELKEAIEKDPFLKHYLNQILNEDYSRIKIPSNMFIWATMNSADQGVFPMDTAFKRRWNFKYFGINDEKAEETIEHIKVNLKGQEISWNKIRKTINDELLTYKINEDKLLGPFFAFNEYVDKEEYEKISDKEFENIFREIFKNKIIMYLFEDAAKAKRDLLFSGVKEKTKKNNVIYSEVCDYFDSDGLKIFCENIRRELDIQ